MTKITTRSGRKIRQIAPGHVVDVATGLHLQKWRVGGFGSRPLWYGMTVGSDEWIWHLNRHRCEDEDPRPRQRRLAAMMPLVARAEAVCALLRVMLAIGGVS